MMVLFIIFRLIQVSLYHKASSHITAVVHSRLVSGRQMPDRKGPQPVTIADSHAMNMIVGVLYRGTGNQSVPNRNLNGKDAKQIRILNIAMLRERLRDMDDETRKRALRTIRNLQEQE